MSDRSAPLVSAGGGTLRLMTDDTDRQNLIDMAAAARALFASLLDPMGGMQNLALGGALFGAGGAASTWLLSNFSAIRLQLIDEVRAEEGLPPMAFPQQRLISNLPAGHSAVPATALLGDLRGGRILDMEPFETFAKTYGLPGMMMAAQLANEVGRIFIEEVPGYEDLEDLLRKEALADELDLLDGPPA